MAGENVSRDECLRVHEKINGKFDRVTDRIDKIYYILILIGGGVLFDVVMRLLNKGG